MRAGKVARSDGLQPFPPIYLFLPHFPPLSPSFPPSPISPHFPYFTLLHQLSVGYRDLGTFGFGTLEA